MSTAPSRSQLRILSLGAGVQSSALLMLAVRGEIEPFDVAELANTGWEPAKVYLHLARLEAIAKHAGIEVVRVSHGHIHAATPSTPPTASRPCRFSPSAPTASVGWRAANALANTRSKR